MSAERAQEELELLRAAYPHLESIEHSGNIWVKITGHAVPKGLWRQEKIAIACKIPAQAGEAPYSFFTLPRMVLKSGATINNYTFPVVTPFEGEWGQFSWAPEESWVIKAKIREGSNMVHFVRSFNERLKGGA